MFYKQKWQHCIKLYLAHFFYLKSVENNKNYPYSELYITLIFVVKDNRNEILLFLLGNCKGLKIISFCILDNMNEKFPCFYLFYTKVNKSFIFRESCNWKLNFIVQCLFCDKNCVYYTYLFLTNESCSLRCVLCINFFKIIATVSRKRLLTVFNYSTKLG